jgi:glycosyltransferase involved in cell wall biosynthesis
MKICLHTIREISPQYVGGTERFMLELAKSLKKLGHFPFIICTGNKKEFELEGVKVAHRIPSGLMEKYKMHGFGNTAFITRFIADADSPVERLSQLGEYTDKQLNSIDADVFHLNSFAASIFSAKAKDAVITNHENDLEYDSSWGKGFTDTFASIVRADLGYLNSAAALTVPSKHYAQFFSQKLGLPVSPIQNGVSLSTFDFHKLAEQRDSLNRNKKKTILVPSRFSPEQKGFDLILESCRILKESHENFRFVFTGVRSDYQRKLDSFLQTAAELGVGGNIEAHYYPDINLAYSNCDIVVSAERFCSYGLSISEALALGIPTILSNIPTYKEIAQDVPYAYFFDKNDANQLAHTILKLTKNYKKPSEEEVNSFRKNNNINNTAAKYCELYMQATGGIYVQERDDERFALLKTA